MLLLFPRHKSKNYNMLLKSSPLRLQGSITRFSHRVSSNFACTTPQLHITPLAAMTTTGRATTTTQQPQEDQPSKLPFPNIASPNQEEDKEENRKDRLYPPEPATPFIPTPQPPPSPLPGEEEPSQPPPEIDPSIPTTTPDIDDPSKRPVEIPSPPDRSPIEMPFPDVIRPEIPQPGGAPPEWTNPRGERYETNLPIN